MASTADASVAEHLEKGRARSLAGAPLRLARDWSSFLPSPVSSDILPVADRPDPDGARHDRSPCSAGLWVMSFIGLRHPLRMLPIFLFEFVWKTIWLLALRAAAMAGRDGIAAIERGSRRDRARPARVRADHPVGLCLAPLCQGAGGALALSFPMVRGHDMKLRARIRSSRRLCRGNRRQAEADRGRADRRADAADRRRWLMRNHSSQVWSWPARLLRIAMTGANADRSAVSTCRPALETRLSRSWAWRCWQRMEGASRMPPHGRAAAVCRSGSSNAHSRHRGRLGLPQLVAANVGPVARFRVAAGGSHPSVATVRMRAPTPYAVTSRFRSRR